jgi:hypothetical protein
MSSLPSRCAHDTDNHTAWDQSSLHFGDDSPSDPDPNELERWLPVPDWPGYEVSDWGQVRSYRMRGGRTRKGHMIALTPMIIGGYVKERTGHLEVCLYRTIDGVKKKWRTGIHVLVLTVFKEPCPPGLQCCHGDSDPTNNRLSNLRWDTPVNNKLDMLWCENGQFKLSNNDVLAIWGRLLAGEKDYRIAKDYGVTNPIIGGIRKGDYWTHVTKNLPGFPLVTAAREAANLEPVRIPTEFADSPIEIWRLLPGHHLYRVSTFGRVETLWYRVRGRKRSEIGDVWIPVIPRVGKYGHLRFSVRNQSGDKKQIGVHVAILLAFAGPCPPGMIGCHDKGDPSDNHASKIRWDSHKANKADALRHAAEKAARAAIA